LITFCSICDEEFFSSSGQTECPNCRKGFKITAQNKLHSMRERSDKKPKKPRQFVKDSAQYNV